MSLTRLRQACPIFPVRDLGSALEHYASLGFAVSAYSGGQDDCFRPADKEAVHPTARSDYYPDDTVPSVAYLVVGDADELAAEWSGEGIGGRRTNPPVDISWGMREGTHFDPDGNLLRFGSPLPHR